MKINYISARPGSGKTRFAIHTIAPHHINEDKNVLMVVPTKKLCDQINIDSNGLFKTIHTGTDTEVITKIQEYFHSSNKGVALVITEAAFNAIAGRIVGANWIVIKDEATEPLEIHTVRCPDSRKLIIDWLNLEKINGRKNHRTLLKALSVSENSPTTSTLNDDILRELHQIKECVRKRHTEVLIDDSRIDHKDPQIIYSIFTKPEIFETFDDVYIMSANFEHTYLYHQWQHVGVKWIDRTPNELKEDFDTSRVRLHFWSEIGAWSKQRRYKEDQLKNYVSWINRELPNGDYIYVINESDIEIPELQLLNGERIPAICHGMNRWRNTTKFVSLSSYLVSRHEEPFYQRYGTSTSDARVLRHTQMLYQQLTRTNLRNKDSKEQIDIYLPTLTEVRELLPYIPNATIVDLGKKFDGHRTGRNGKLRNDWRYSSSPESDVIPNEPKYALGENTTSKYATCICGAFLLEQLLRIPSKDNLVLEKDPYNIILYPSFSRTKQKHNYQRRWQTNRPIHPLIAYLKYCAKISIGGATKDQINNIKLTELEFFITGIVNDKNTFKKASMIGNNDLIALDFDNSELSSRDISRIFKEMEYMTYTTINHNSSSNKRRFRLVVPCSRTMSINEHRKIMTFWREEIQRYSKENGKQSGLDEKCLGPERKFYIPHFESEINHTYENKIVLDVDIFLSKIPRGQVVDIPTTKDLININCKKNKEDHSTIPSRILEQLNAMVPGDRSTRAVKVGGMIKSLGLNESNTEEIFNIMQEKGVDKSAIRQAKIYSKK